LISAQGWRAALLTILISAAALGFSAAQDLEDQYRDAAARFHKLRAASGPASAWESSARQFLGIHDINPKHRRGPHALFSAGLAYREAYAASRDRKYLSLAVETFHRFVAAFPEDNLADDSLVHIGDLFANEYKDPQVAYVEYQRVWERYPQGDQAGLARARAAALEPMVRPSLTGSSSVLEAQAQPVALNLGPAAGTAAPAGIAGPAVTLKRVQYLSTLEWTRVILTVSGPVPFRHAEIPAERDKPARLYIDLPNTGTLPDLPLRHDVKDDALTQIRIGRADGADLRVVLDLSPVERYAVKSFDLPLESKIVLDLYGKREPVAAKKPVSPNPPAAQLPGEAAQARSLSRALGLKVRTIVIDAGHGGHDPGAVAFGVKEKELTLQITLALRDVIQRKRPDLKVVLTRDGDRYIGLQERTRMASQAGADLFVSIHLNANEIERFSGVETYFLNLTTDASALEVAARENASTEKQVSDLNVILLDLLRDTNIVESGRLAHTLQNTVVGELRSAQGVKDLGVKQAPFMVLLGSEVPSVLIEAGFLTNREENRRLREAGYQERIAEGIYAGLSAYIEGQTIARTHSPQGEAARHDSAHPASASLVQN